MTPLELWKSRRKPGASHTGWAKGEFHIFSEASFGGPFSPGILFESMRVCSWERQLVPLGHWFEVFGSCTRPQSRLVVLSFLQT